MTSAKIKFSLLLITLFLAVLGGTSLLLNGKNKNVQGTRNIASAAMAQPAGLNIVKTEDFDDWRLECTKVSKGGQDFCRIFQRLARGEGDKKKVVLSASVVMAQKKTEQGMETFPLLRLITPDGVHLPTGVVASIDAGQQFKIPYQICTPAKCIAERPLANEVLQNIQSGKVMAVAFRRSQPKPVVMNVSLKGFAAALDALSHQVPDKNTATPSESKG